MDLAAVQECLEKYRYEGWLFYDHHHRDLLAYRILGLDAGAHVTRRWFYLVPAEGEPVKLVNRIEAGRLDSLPGKKLEYSSWQELEKHLGEMLKTIHRVAMQYSSRNAIPQVSMVDAGTVELVRSFGVEVVSSADLVSQFEAVLNEARIESHFVAQRKIDSIVENAWREIAARVRTENCDEFAMVRWLSESMRRESLVWEHGPNVSCGPNSADSHYEPSAATSRPIRRGDFVLIDIWGKLPEADAVYYDITWTGVVDRPPTDREATIFRTVRDARDAAIKRVQSAFGQQRPIAGFEADDAAREVIRSAGYADWFTHRMGHNIGTEIHGAGANLDNLETHDERIILPNTCFSVEPGIYFPGEFGVRSEINMITRPGKAEVTGRVQTDLVRI